MSAGLLGGPIDHRGTGNSLGREDMKTGKVSLIINLTNFTVFLILILHREYLLSIKIKSRARDQALYLTTHFYFSWRLCYHLGVRVLLSKQT